MPLYTFVNTHTNEIFDDFMTISQKETYLSENPHIKQPLATPGYADPVRLGVTRTDQGFKEALQKVQEAHPINEINV